MRRDAGGMSLNLSDKEIPGLVALFWKSYRGKLKVAPGSGPRSADAWSEFPARHRWAVSCPHHLRSAPRVRLKRGSLSGNGAGNRRLAPGPRPCRADL